MNRQQFDRIVRSVAQVTGKADVLVIGSQSILGWHPELTVPEVVMSPDLDTSVPDITDEELHEIAGVLGVGSDFADSNEGAYADSVVVDEVAKLPAGWRQRMLAVETPNLITPKHVQARAWCLHPNDLLVSKYVAARPKDYPFCAALIELNLPEVSRAAIEAGLRDVAERYPTALPRVEIGLAKVRRAFERSNRRLD